MKVDLLIHKLFEIGAIRFGQFPLKEGIISPFYIDLRLCISVPKLLVFISEMLHEKIRHKKMDLLCGVPYAAVPFATAISIQHSIPMILFREKTKEYGTKKQIEGIYEKDQTCALIDDVISSGKSAYETIVALSKKDLIIEDIAIIVDREQGGKKFLESHGFHVHPICSMTQILDELLKEKKIEQETAENSLQFIRNHSC